MRRPPEPFRCFAVRGDAPPRSTPSLGKERPISALADLLASLRSRSGDQTFLDRLEDVRWRLIWVLATFVVTAAVGFGVAMKYDVLGVLVEPIKPFLHGSKLKYLSPTEPFFVTLRIGVLLGAVVTVPVLVYHLWRVVRPLLGAEERRLVLPSLVAAVGLFVGGVVFCFFAVVPLMLRFTMNFQTESLEQNIVVGEYLSLVLHLLVAFGLAFELPVVMLIGTALGILTPEMLVAKRRHAIAAAVVLGAVLTPPDVASQVLMAGPLYLLFEIGIVVSRVAVARGFGGRPLAAPESS